MHTATLTKNQLRTLVKDMVLEQIQAILADPDFGLSLTPRAERRLQHANRMAVRRRVKSADEIITRLRLSV